ncbi:hypothetical protein HI914_00110 [Erysiphe necator]|nr:hypothetical protein HI914_00110 [Erysiphe necator]
MLGLWLLVVFAAFTTQADDSCISNVNLDGYKWDVTEWSAGCARSGCYYHFKISGSAFDSGIKIPAFAASCSGYKDGDPFVPCKMNDPADDPSLAVGARLQDRQLSGPGAHIVVSYKFPDASQSDTFYNYTGYATSSFNQFVAPEQNFTITPTEFAEGV